MTAAPGQPHACKNCSGIDPDSCLMNPNRPAVPDLRDAPDDTILEPGHCGHVTSFAGAAVECSLGFDHGGGIHQAHVTSARARRSPLGSFDEVKVTATVEWVDTRPAATLGDVRALIRASDSQTDAGRQS